MCACVWGSMHAYARQKLYATDGCRQAGDLLLDGVDCPLAEMFASWGKGGHEERSFSEAGWLVYLIMCVFVCVCNSVEIPQGGTPKQQRFPWEKWRFRFVWRRQTVLFARPCKRLQLYGPGMCCTGCMRKTFSAIGLATKPNRWLTSVLQLVWHYVSV